jgi:hypothetical protein
MRAFGFRSRQFDRSPSLSRRFRLRYSRLRAERSCDHDVFLKVAGVLCQCSAAHQTAQRYLEGGTAWRRGHEDIPEARAVTSLSEMRRYKRGTAKSGPGGKGGRVKSRKQAIAIGLSMARKKGKKVPRKKAS